MNAIKKIGVLSSAPALVLAFLLFSSPVYAATSPGLGIANSFSILASTYSNTTTGTTINGDVGYTVPPAVAPTINGAVHVADGTYNQAGIDQGTALSALNNQACSYSFSPGNIDLATDTTHGPVGNYTPGVYCIDGAASIGTGGITLTGPGAYIFRMDGALTSTANSVVTLAGGASACDIWWTPTSATTLGANSTFAGSDISAAGITIGNLTTWTGRALAFGGTVTTSRNTINTIPACSATSNPSSGNPTNTGGGAGAGTSSGNGSGAGAPGLPNTGQSGYSNSLSWWSLPVALLAVVPVAYLIRKKSLKTA